MKTAEQLAKRTDRGLRNVERFVFFLLGGAFTAAAIVVFMIIFAAR